MRRIGHPWITAMVHYLDAEGGLPDVPAPARSLVNHLGASVSTLTSHPPGELRQTAVKCRRRPGRRPCGGQIRAVIEVGSGGISWACPACGDNRVIHQWEGRPGTRHGWDVGRLTPRISSGRRAWLAASCG